MRLNGWGRSESEEVINLVNFYLKNITWSKGPTMFTMPMCDYLELCGFSPEDAYWFGEEILDIVNNEWSPI